MTPAQIRDYLKYYRDLGIETIYRATAPPITAPIAAAIPAGAAIVMAKTPPLPAETLPDSAPAGDTLAKIREDIGDCKRCRLCEARNKIVFGAGNETSPLVFVGEGPGADEDEQGLPFVGRAGQLLTQMIENTAAKEGIPIKRSTAAGRNGNLRTVSVPATADHQAEGDLCSGRDGDEGVAQYQRRYHQVAGTMAEVARYSGDGDISPVVPAAAVQCASETRGLGRFENIAAFCV